ncbi:MAG TPA: hypothetical protein VGW34_09490 [Allosphingosinicella sp.]|nr:hypothetical protein [Allosphingosinicella sp.]
MISDVRALRSARPSGGSRSERREVRNPILALPAAQAMQGLDPSTRLLLARLLRDLQADAQARAQMCWRKHKAPMACYWKAVAVYTGHLAKVLR